MFKTTPVGKLKMHERVLLGIEINFLTERPVQTSSQKE